MMGGSRPIRLCYERELIASPKALEGRLLLRWTIDGQGRVSRVEVVRDSLDSSSLRKCIMARILTWRFPPCPMTCQVVYPFDFYPRMIRSREWQVPCRDPAQLHSRILGWVETGSRVHLKIPDRARCFIRRPGKARGQRNTCGISSAE